MPETSPMAEPTAPNPQGPGSCRDGLGLRSKYIWVARKPTKTANTMAKVVPLMRAKIQALATNEPSKTPGTRLKATGQRTLPRRWWARTLEMDVTRMVAMAVAIAILTPSEEATPCSAK